MEGAGAACAADLFTGFKVAAALAATAAVVAEFVSSDRGLGYLLVDYTNRFDTPGVFAAILVLSFMGLLTYAAVEAMERLLIPWHDRMRIADRDRGRGLTLTRIEPRKMEETMKLKMLLFSARC